MEHPIEEQLHSIKTNPRNAYIAFFLSLLLPGLGQIYNGQPKKAMMLFGLLILNPILFRLTGLTSIFYGIAFVTFLEIVLRLFAMYDAAKHAKQQNDYILKSYNTWYYHLLVAIVMAGILLILDVRSLTGMQAFTIPTTSNHPTLQQGDWVMADTKAYKNKEPDYGDIVAYSVPDEQIYIFRIVGKPNDRISIVDNIVNINGITSESSFIKDTTCDDTPVMEYEEILPNKHKHLLYKSKFPYDSTKANINNIVVPDDSYYVLGDYRDNAVDSRYDGFISKDRIKGRIMYSYWGKTPDRINVNFRDK